MTAQTTKGADREQTRRDDLPRQPVESYYSGTPDQYRSNPNQTRRDAILQAHVRGFKAWANDPGDSRTEWVLTREEARLVLAELEQAEAERGLKEEQRNAYALRVTDLERKLEQVERERGT